MFRRLRYRIALQFTGLVFALMLIVGGAFIGAQYLGSHRATSDQLKTDAAQFRAKLAETGMDDAGIAAAAVTMDDVAVRVFSSKGEILYSSELFGRLAVAMQQDGAARFFTIKGSGGYYRVYQVPLGSSADESLFLQIAYPERIDLHELPGEAILFGVVAVVVTSLTFLFGLLFAKRSLTPAEAMVGRLRQFTHDASHELRTPLAAVGSSLDMALKTGDYESEIRAAKDELRQSSRLIERLLQLAELDELALVPTPVDMSALVTREAERHRPEAAQAGLELVSDVTTGMVVHCDEGTARQLIDNLLANAIKFTPRGGRITLELTSRGLSVRDTGVGIPSEALPYVFERFYRVDQSGSAEGSGLGLAMVARIVEAHGWEIHVESHPGRGSTFTVTFEG
jgi:signal transduction histidine kinase